MLEGQASLSRLHVPPKHGCSVSTDNYVNSCVEVTKKVKRCDFLPQFFPGTRPDSSLDYVTSVFFHILSNSLVCSSSYHIHNMQYELRRAPFNEA